MNKVEKGKLYICPTPIGNLEDITIRTIKTLEFVDLIAAEDTRHTLKLLNHYDIRKPLISYHMHNLREREMELIYKLGKGENIALVSDAGMPGISDPGFDIIKAAIENNIDVVVLPGPTASITALVASGLNTERFNFEGFLSSKKKDRKARLEELSQVRNTLIFYESPHRLLDCLRDIFQVFGDRNMAIAREITKLHEEVYRNRVGLCIEEFSTRNIRGEIVLIVEGNTEEEVAEEVDISLELKKCIGAGMTKKEAVKFVSDSFKIPKNIVYRESLNI